MGLNGDDVHLYWTTLSRYCLRLPSLKVLTQHANDSEFRGNYTYIGKNKEQRTTEDEGYTQ